MAVPAVERLETPLLDEVETAGRGGRGDQAATEQGREPEDGRDVAHDLSSEAEVKNITPLLEKTASLM
jgi:hypothetical protein